MSFLFFFFNDTATTEIYTLSLHDALPICATRWRSSQARAYSNGSASSTFSRQTSVPRASRNRDRKSTRLNSSHLVISYAVFCLKKKKNQPLEARVQHDSMVQDPLLTPTDR